MTLSCSLINSLPEGWPIFMSLFLKTSAFPNPEGHGWPTSPFAAQFFHYIWGPPEEEMLIIKDPRIAETDCSVARHQFWILAFEKFSLLFDLRLLVIRGKKLSMEISKLTDYTALTCFSPIQRLSYPSEVLRGLDSLAAVWINYGPPAKGLIPSYLEASQIVRDGITGV